MAQRVRFAVYSLQGLVNKPKFGFSWILGYFLTGFGSFRFFLRYWTSVCSSLKILVWKFLVKDSRSIQFGTDFLQSSDFLPLIFRQGSNPFLNPRGHFSRIWPSKFGVKDENQEKYGVDCQSQEKTFIQTVLPTLSSFDDLPNSWKFLPLKRIFMPLTFYVKSN